jgi:hypothetical protein
MKLLLNASLFFGIFGSIQLLEYGFFAEGIAFLALSLLIVYLRYKEA